MSTVETTARRTPLHDLHVELGGKLVDFAGWELPVQYSQGIKVEHLHCRAKASLFDVSHMGQVELHGANVANALEKLVPSNIDGLPVGKARYTVLTNDEGGIKDDLIVSNAGDYLFVVVNASMRDQDIEHLRNNLSGCEVNELSDRALIAIQGPKAESVVSKHVNEVVNLKFMETTQLKILGADCRISRLGYTGEDGFEISIPADNVVEITKEFLKDDNCEPAGLGSRDSLRLEAGLCLYGNDIDETTSPVEAQLNWIIQKRRREQAGFLGAERVIREFNQGPARKLVGIKPEGGAPARRGTVICDQSDNQIGEITSGGFGPSINGPISMGYVSADFSESGTKVNLLVRDKSLPASVFTMPFVTQNYKR